MTYQNTQAFALEADKQDPFYSFRDRFYFPQHEGRNVVYFCGNSLGLQPKNAEEHLQVELEDWRKFGVEGHFEARNPWLNYHKRLTEGAAALVGGLPHEVVMMNNLTVNLHLMMVSFYRPTKERFKIMIEGGAFPSDQYAVETQAKFHGFDPEQAIIELAPREGEHTLRTEDIEAEIQKHADSLALVMLGGVNYYTGQAYDMKSITAAAHKVGAKAGFDLAHAAGNIPLNLHDWNVDFAVWCTYKYLNSGPGGTSGAFVHEKHAENPDLPRFAGWWGYEEDTRFLMKKGFKPMRGAQGWQLSNAQVFPMALHKASLEIIEEAGGISALREKSILLTGYLEYLIECFNAEQDRFQINIITPKEAKDRGCQLSLVVDGGREIYDRLTANGVISDWREPDVIRVAPVPLYNSFEDCYRFYEILKGL